MRAMIASESRQFLIGGDMPVDRAGFGAMRFAANDLHGSAESIGVRLSTRSAATSSHCQLRRPLAYRRTRLRIEHTPRARSWLRFSYGPHCISKGGADGRAISRVLHEFTDEEARLLVDLLSPLIANFDHLASAMCRPKRGSLKGRAGARRLAPACDGHQTEEGIQHERSYHPDPRRTHRLHR